MIKKNVPLYNMLATHIHTFQNDKGRVPTPWQPRSYLVYSNTAQIIDAPLQELFKGIHLLIR